MLRLPKGVTVIDDSYNSSPSALKLSLDVLSRTWATRRVAVIGEMLELGADSAHEHRAAGALAAELGVDVLISVGPGAAPVAAGFIRAGGGAAHGTGDLDEAREVLHTLLRPGDVALVKSSNGSGLGRLGDDLVAGGTVAANR